MMTIEKVLVLLSGKGLKVQDKVREVLSENGLVYPEERGYGTGSIEEYDAQYMNTTFKHLEAKLGDIEGIVTDVTEEVNEDDFDGSMVHELTLTVRYA